MILGIVINQTITDDSPLAQAFVMLPAWSHDWPEPPSTAAAEPEA